MPDKNPLQTLTKATAIGPDTSQQSISETLAQPLTLGAVPDLDMLKSLGKPISELLGTIFETPTGSGLPAKLRLTNWDARTGEAAMHGLRKASEEFRASPKQLDQLIKGGSVDVAQPPQGAVDRIQRLLANLLGQ